MRKNAEKMDLSSRNRLLRVPAGSHGFWAHDPLPDPSHDPDVDPRRVTIPLAFTNRRRSRGAMLRLATSTLQSVIKRSSFVVFLCTRCCSIPCVPHSALFAIANTSSTRHHAEPGESVHIAGALGDQGGRCAAQ